MFRSHYYFGCYRPLVSTKGALRCVPVAMVMLVMALVSVTPTTALGGPNSTADVVYGQLGSFTTGTPNKTGINDDGLLTPQGAVADGSGNLYVADSFNSRVLFYTAGSTTATR